MEYTLLIIGKNEKLLTEFFDNFADTYTLVSSSSHVADFKAHMEMIKPDICVIDLKELNEELAALIKAAKNDPDVTPPIFVGVAFDEADEKNAEGVTGYVIKGEINHETLRANLVEFVADAEKKRAKLAMLKEMAQASMKHILVIDDDPMMLKLIKEQLADRFTVATAISGKIAYKFLEKKKTDLILLDYEMPEENGPKVLDNIRKMPGMADVPVVFLTGIAEQSKIVEVVKLKPQGYILKPVDYVQLFDLIDKILGPKDE